MDKKNGNGNRLGKSSPSTSLPDLPINPRSPRNGQDGSRKFNASTNGIPKNQSFDLEAACERNEKRIRKLEKVVQQLSEDLKSPRRK